MSRSRVSGDAGRRRVFISEAWARPIGTPVADDISDWERTDPASEAERERMRPYAEQASVRPYLLPLAPTAGALIFILYQPTAAFTAPWPIGRAPSPTPPIRSSRR